MAFECNVSNRSTSCVSIIQPYWFRPDGALGFSRPPVIRRVRAVRCFGFNSAVFATLERISISSVSGSNPVVETPRAQRGFVMNWRAVSVTILRSRRQIRTVGFRPKMLDSRSFSDWTSASVCFESALMKSEQFSPVSIFLRSAPDGPKAVRIFV